ncbi:hypothetical protein FOZ63_026034, partial [Perkinsus olseni]
LRDNLTDYYSQLRDDRRDERVQLGSLVDMAWSMCASSIHSDLLYDIVKEIYEAPPPRNRDILAKMTEVDKAVAVEGRGAEAPEAWLAAFAEAQRMEIERTEKSRLHFELLDALDALRGARGLDNRLDIMRNQKIGGYVVDFFDEKANLVIEMDTLNKPTPLIWRRRNRTAEDQSIFLRTLVKEALQASAVALRGKYYKGYLGKYCHSNFTVSVSFNDESNFVTFRMGRGRCDPVAVTVSYGKAGNNTFKTKWDIWNNGRRRNMLDTFKTSCYLGNLTKHAADDEGKFLSKITLEGESLEVLLFSDLSIVFRAPSASAAGLRGKYYEGYLGEYCPSGFNLSVRFHDISNFVTLKMGGQASVVAAMVSYFETGSNTLKVAWGSWKEYEKNTMLRAFKKACRVSDLTKDADDDEGKFLSEMVLDGESLEVLLFADLSIVIPSRSVRT